MTIKIDPAKVAAISLADLNTLAEIVDYVSKTNDSSEWRRLCDRMGTHFHDLFMGSRDAIMVDQRFETLRNER